MSLPSPVHIETERLVLTMPGRQDAPLMVDYFTRNRAHLRHWEPAYPDGFFTNAYWEARLEDARQELIDDRALRLVIFRRGAERRAIGIANFTAIIRLAFNCTNLGYSIDAEHQGQGLMYEALSGAIQHVFSEMNIHRIQANYQPDNHRSGRLLDRLGFAIEGYARSYLLIDGAYRDHVLTSLTNPDWRMPER